MLLCGGAIVFAGEGFRRVEGVFLLPITEDLALGRGFFGLTLAVQALVFGLVQPVVGLVSDRFGVARVLAVSAIVYALGMAFASQANSGFELMLALGLFVGVALAGTTQNVVLGAVGRAVPNERRGVVFGAVIASGSLGMFVLAPLLQGGIDAFGWRDTFVVVAAAFILLPVLAIGLMNDAVPRGVRIEQSVREALYEAGAHQGFVLLTIGFFVCGFHVAFIGSHLQAFFVDEGLSPIIGATAISVIGLANVFGAFLFGWLGDRYRKKNLLSLLYLLRAVAMGAMLALPVTNAVAMGFAVVVGVLWLGTVPLTSGIVAQVFGTRHFSFLFGIVLAGHQLGWFFGAWLGGVVHDLSGSYDLMWLLAVGLGLIAAAIHWPIDDRPLARLEVSGA